MGTPSVREGGLVEEGQQQRGRTLTLRLLHRTQPSLDFCGHTGSVPAMVPLYNHHLPSRNANLVFEVDKHTRCGRFFRASWGPTTLRTGPPCPLLETRNVFANAVTRIEAIAVAQGVCMEIQLGGSNQGKGGVSCHTTLPTKQYKADVPFLKSDGYIHTHSRQTHTNGGNQQRKCEGADLLKHRTKPVLSPWARRSNCRPN